ncbi:MAG: phage virion morphogenesis protein [Candidatus Zixiibacteriota bacterium]
MRVSFDWPTAEQRAVRQTLTMTRTAVTDLRPVFERFRGTLRMRHRRTMDTMTDPITGQPWTPLTEKHKSRKPSGTQARILYFTGVMRRALTVFQAPWSIYHATPVSMIWGIDSPEVYPLFHQTTQRRRKDGQPLRRGFMGMVLPDDLNTLTRFVRTHIIGMQAKGGVKGAT